MKKWIIIIICIIVALIIIGVLHEAGYLNFKWQTLTTIFAFLASPFTYLKNKLFNKNSPDNVNQLIKEAKESIAENQGIEDNYQKNISAKEAEISKLEEKVNNLNKKLNKVEQEKEYTPTYVRELSAEEMAIEFEKLYGNQKDD